MPFSVFSGISLNKSEEGIWTAHYYQDRGDGNSDWVNKVVAYPGALDDGAIETIGLKADTAVTAVDTTPGSVVALLKGISSKLTTYLGTVAATSLLKREDDPHANNDVGVAVWGVRRNTAAVSSGADGDYEPFQMDGNGRLRVATIRDVTGGHPSIIASGSSLVASLIVKASPGNLHALIGYSTTTQFIQVHNSTTLPANGASPLVSQPITANVPFNIPLPDAPFSTGIVVSNSTTGPTKTIGGADTFITAIYD